MDRGAIEAMLAAVRAIDACTIDVGPDGLDVPMLVRPTGGGAVSVESVRAEVDRWRERPERRSGTAVLGDLASFIAHANRFKDPDSAIFVEGGDEDDPPTFLSVLDYHERINHPMDDGGWIAADNPQPRFGKHRGAYKPEFSKQWAAWSEANGSALAQADFSKLIEDNAADIFDVDMRHPESLGDLASWFAQRFGGKLVRDDGAASFYASCQALLDVAEKLVVTEKATVGESARRDGGSTSITFESETTTSVIVPPAFVIAIPVFEGGDLYQIPARLRVTLRRDGDSKRTQWQVDLYGVERTLRAALDDAKEQISKATGLPIFVGSPEA